MDDDGRTLHIFNDYNGHFWTRPCAFDKQFAPIIQHDKARDMRNAVIHQRLETSLCNFHGLAAYREHIQQDPALKPFLEALLTGFKAVMRAWCPRVQDSLIMSYKLFISNIPPQTIPDGAKFKLLNYLDKQWFSYPWKEAMSADIFFRIPVESRSNPLLSTNNTTERKFKEIDSTDLNNIVNKKMFSIVWLFIDSVMYRDVKLSYENSENNKHKRIWEKGVELECVKKALFIIQNDGVRWLPDYHVHGWVLVTSQHHIESDNMNVQPPLFDPISQRDHDYDVKAKPRNFLADLDFTASIAWRSELESHLPLQNVKIPVYQHICNLYLGICSCRSFLKKGQPYFCKHLYAIHAALRQLNSPVQIVEYCQYITPSLTSYLAEIYQIKHPSPLFSHSELDLVKNLISQSHEATAEELQLAKQGKLLQKLNQTQHWTLTKLVFLELLLNARRITVVNDGWGVP